MKRLFLTIISLFLLQITTSAAVAGCNAGSLPSNHQQAINTSNPDHAAFSMAVRYYSNLERCRKGLAPFAADPSLLKASVTHSANMAKAYNMSHNLNVRGQRNLKERMRSANVSMRTAAENIAQNFVYVLADRARSLATRGPCQFNYTNGQAIPRHTYGSLAQEQVARWMASSKHRANLLSRKMNRMEAAFGYAAEQSSCGFLYITQDFAG